MPPDRAEHFVGFHSALFLTGPIDHSSHDELWSKYLLNLDIAELFKPVIVDRAIFTLVNKRLISATEHNEVEKILKLVNHGKEYRPYKYY